MAKRTGRRKGKPLKVLRVTNALTVGALAAQDMISDLFAGVVDDDTYLISADLLWSVVGFTAGEGPVVVGIAHSDYTAAEIEQWFEAAAIWDSGDLVNRENAARKCREVGTFSLVGTAEVLNDGKPIRTPLKFRIAEGDTLQLWAFNQSNGTFTTGGEVRCSGKVFAR